MESMSEWSREAGAGSRESGAGSWEPKARSREPGKGHVIKKEYKIREWKY